MKYIPQAQADEAALLKSIGLKSTEDLFSNIPAPLRATKKKFDYPQAQSEIEIRRTFKDFVEVQNVPSLSFAGGGIYSHDIPSVVPFVQSRSEFATAYTPYQPEISQGTLQAIFEFQTLVCQLTECELSNASLYDGATSLCEAVLMGLRLKKKSSGKILIPANLHPHYSAVLATYLEEFKERLQTLPYDSETGLVSESALAKILEAGGVDLLVTQSPNVFGGIENYSNMSKLVKKTEALWVTSTMEPLSWALLRGPGAFGAHIVTAEGQSFGNGAYLGGSSFGIFATRNEYLRNLPGRLVGETVDEKNRRSYTLTFATREQFIRRDKATSNICTNQNLNMLGGLVYLSTLGKKGLRELALQNFSLTEFLKKEIQAQTSFKISKASTFNEFTLDLGAKLTAKELISRAEAEGWVPGVDLGQWKNEKSREEWKHKLLIHVNELHGLKSLQKLVQFLKKAH